METGEKNRNTDLTVTEIKAAYDAVLKYIKTIL